MRTLKCEHPLDLKPANDLTPETKLYHLVQNWLKLHPGTLIPLDAWRRKLEAYGLTGKTEFEIQTTNHVLSVENPGMIPVLAAISLGDDLDYLSRVVSHHSCSFYDSDSFGVGQFNEGPSLGESGAGIAIMSRQRVERLFIGAILKNSEQLEVMKSYIDVPGNTISIPVVLSDQVELWPETLINNTSSRARAGVDENLPLAQPMQLDELMGSDLDLTSFPDSKILSMLRRGGIFIDDARVDHQCPVFFFEKLFDLEKPEWKINQEAVTRAINSATGDDRAAIGRKLKAIMLNAHSADSPRLAAALSIYRTIDRNAYAEVFDSAVLKVNNLRHATSMGIDASGQPSIDPARILTELFKEIMGVKPEDFRAFHFNSLGSLATHWEDAHGAKDVDINILVKHVMAGLKSFLAYPSRDRNENLDEQVNEDCSQFLKMALKLATPSYPTLNELDSESKLFMVRSGYKIKYFKGMTHQDKGRVLSDDLGL